MAALETPEVKTGWKAVDFKLEATDGKFYGLSDIKGKNGLVVMFICNHCPFVKAIIDKIVTDMKELKNYGVNSIAIMANDTVNYPDDSFENMKKLANSMQFPFPYVIDRTQEIAKAYDAVCTPDFFGFNANLELQYRGRLDDSKMEKKSTNTRDLFNAMVEISKTGKCPAKQYHSIGCSIKWL